MRSEALLSILTALYTLLSFWCQPAKAAIAINTELKVSPLLGYELQTLEDPTHSLQLSDVLKLPSDRFLRSSKDTPNFGFTHATIWVHGVIALEHSQPLPIVLEYGYAPTDEVEVFWLHDGKILSHELSGDRMKASARSLRYRLPSFALDVPPGTTDFYLRLRSSGALNVPLRLYEAHYFQEKILQETSFLMVLFTILLVMFMVNALFAIIMRSTTYGLYCAYILATFFNSFGQYAMPKMYLSDDLARFLCNEGMAIAAGLSGTCAALFTLAFLKMTERSRKVRQSLLAAAGLCTFGSLVGAWQYAIGIEIIYGGVACTGLAIIWATTLALRQRYRPAIFFASAWAVVLVAALIVPLSQLGILPLNLWTTWSALIGTCLEAILLTMALADSWRIQQQRAQELIIEQERARTVFFQNTSHELRTPLNGIIGFLQLVIEERYGELTPLARDKISKAIHMAQGLRHQVNTILDLARSRRSDMPLHAQELRIEDILAAADELAEGLSFRTPQAQYSSELNFGAPTFVGDFDKISTLVRNLLSNAFKFSDTDRANHIHLSLSGNEHQLLIKVTDTGIGIAEAHHASIFEEFQRIEHEKHQSFEGTGLGLAMVRELVHLMSGKITLESALGVGSCFHIHIPALPLSPLLAPKLTSTEELESILGTQNDQKPIIPASLDQIYAIEDISSPNPQSPAVVSSLPALPKGNKASILVVDDQPLNCELISDILGLDHYHVIIAHNGQEGLAIIKIERPDLILLDLMMPGISGEDFLNAMRAEEHLRGIPVILLTARSSHTDKIQGLALGASDYIPKPIVPEELRIKVRNLVERAHYLRQAEVAPQIAKLQQLGELFQELAHELKNILQSSEGIDGLKVQDTALSLSVLSLSAEIQADLAQALLHPQVFVEDSQPMPLAADAAHDPLHRRLQNHLLYLPLAHEKKVALWEQLLTLPYEELVFAESHIRIYMQYMSLVDSIHRCRDLSQATLQYTRIHSNTLESSLEDIWENVCILAQAKIRRIHPTIRTGTLTSVIPMAPDRLTQLLLNLLINALDAIEELPQEDRWITFACEAHPTNVRFEIENGGPQIPESLMERIFERGFSSKGVKGSGLGLAICRDLVQEVGGEITALPTRHHPTFSVLFKLDPLIVAKKQSL